MMAGAARYDGPLALLLRRGSAVAQRGGDKASLRRGLFSSFHPFYFLPLLFSPFTFSVFHFFALHLRAKRTEERVREGLFLLLFSISGAYFFVFPLTALFFLLYLHKKLPII